MKKYPELVTKLTTLCDGWLFGSSADPDKENPRDYDVFIPIAYWSLACGMIPKDSTINRNGGFKAISEGIEVDVWTCEMDKLFTTNYFNFAYHPKSGIRIKRI